MPFLAYWRTKILDAHKFGSLHLQNEALKSVQEKLQYIKPFFINLVDYGNCFSVQCALPNLHIFRNSLTRGLCSLSCRCTNRLLPKFLLIGGFTNIWTNIYCERSHFWCIPRVWKIDKEMRLKNSFNLNTLVHIGLRYVRLFISSCHLALRAPRKHDIPWYRATIDQFNRVNQ